jgi:hypothetical protein
VAFITPAVITAPSASAATCSGPGDFGAQYYSASWPGGFTGVPVYSNGTAGYQSNCYNHVSTPSGVSAESGMEWQCVELINRLYITKGWIDKTWRGDGDQLYYDPPVDPATGKHLVTQPQGSISYLAPGDVISFSDKAVSGGHAAVVSAVSGSSITLVNQNTAKSNTLSHGALSAGKLVMTGWKGYDPIGVIHAPGGWTAAEAPLPGSVTNLSYAVVDGVSCPSVSVCAAVGDYVENWTISEGLLLTSKAGGWTPVKAPLPANAAKLHSVQVNAVSCPSASECIAVGSYGTGKPATTEGLVLTWSGGAWAATQAPLPGNAGKGPGAALNAVSCPSTSKCIAAGQYQDASGNWEGLLLTRSGGTWTAAKAPQPGNAAKNPEIALNGLSCPATAKCVAVGVYADKSQRGEGLLLTWSGQAWAAAEAPRPSGIPGNAGQEVNAVSCPAPSQCVATGQYTDTSDNEYGLLLTWSGGAWTAAPAPLPGNIVKTQLAGLNAVSCPSTSQCSAAGTYLYKHNQHALLLAWTGGTWTAADGPLPANTASPQVADLHAMSCPSVSECVAGGLYTDDSGISDGLLLTWSG